MDAKTVHQMTFTNLQKSAHRFIAKEPLQICHNCDNGTSKSGPTLRSQLQGWRITCPIAADRTRTWLNAAAAIHSINIIPPHFVARSCSTMMQNAASKPGHHLWNSPASF